MLAAVVVDQLKTSGVVDVSQFESECHPPLKVLQAAGHRKRHQKDS